MSTPTTTDTDLVEQVGPPTNRVTLAIRHVVSDLGKNGIFIALVAVLLLFSITTNGILLRPQNISNLIVQNGYILVLAIGMVLIIVAGHIDLSVGSVAAFIGAVSGVFAVHWGLPWWLAIILSLLVGAVVGVAAGAHPEQCGGGGVDGSRSRGRHPTTVPFATRIRSSTVAR